MNRCNIVQTLSFCAGLMLLLAMAMAAQGAEAPRRQILICVSDAASPAIRQAADDLFAHAAEVPVLKALIQTQQAGPVVRASSEAVLKNYDRAAYNHLVVIGLPSHDPLVTKVWEHYATVDEPKREIYAQGWGALMGNLGYVEADRNPFLHSRKIREAPFETILVKLSGTSEAGVLAAVNAFAQDAVLNGLIPAGPFTRPRTTLLDMDPLTVRPGVPLPAFVTGEAAGKPWPLAGWTQVPANEYRAFIDTAGVEPLRAWRVKYLQPGVLEDAGVKGWMGGLHRMAFGNALTLAEFASPEQANRAAQAIGQSKGWRVLDKRPGHLAWQADQPTDEVMAESLGKVTVFATGPFLILSTLPDSAVDQVRQATRTATSIAR